MQAKFPYTRDLVLVGGGHTHALFLKMWGMKPLAGVRLTLIDPSPVAAYSGMLPGFVAGHYTADDLSIDLVRLCRFAGARYVAGAAAGIDREKQVILIEGRPPVSYDVVSIDIGIHSRMAINGFDASAVAVKPLWRFAEAWQSFLSENERGKRVVTIGGGVAGVELALAAKHALGNGAEIIVLDRDEVLRAVPSRARSKLLKTLELNGVVCRGDVEISHITDRHVHLADGGSVAADFVLGAAGARPHSWVKQIGLDLKDGFICVDENLRSSDPSIFAVGDCAHMEFAPRPKAGVFAVRQAPILFHNLRAALSSQKLRSYRPQKDYLKLISLGDKSAMAEKRGLVLKGHVLWVLKDRIDRGFMRKLQNLSTMGRDALPDLKADGLQEEYGTVPYCAGCGAKVAGTALAAALDGATGQLRDDVMVLHGDDAAVIGENGRRQVVTTDHLSAISDDPVMMTRIALVHALGDIWAMGAVPQALLVSLTVPKMSPELQVRTMSEIMQTADREARKFGAAIAGGHSALGDNLVVGFTATGLIEGEPITRSGAQLGDALILTKPIGIGVLMAAEMRGLACGNDVVKAFEAMCQPQDTSSQILATAHAMTDVTGFGLAGHLAGICRSSRCGARISLDAIPFLDGAVELSLAGVRSSLFEHNRTSSGAVFGASGATADLLFDPQTAGGLLAVVPEVTADELLIKLRGAGYPAARIGTITNEEGVIQVY